MKTVGPTPENLWAVQATCESTWPAARSTRRHWPAAAELLAAWLKEPIIVWERVDLDILEALRDDTWSYPTTDDLWELDEEDLPDLTRNAWHLVFSATGWVAYERLPVMPQSDHPFY